MSNLRISMVVPTYNGGALWERSAESISKYFNGKVLVIDSGSKDLSVGIAKDHGFELIEINSSDFNHGGTRNLGVNHLSSSSDLVFFMTQDAILTSEHSINNIVDMFIANEKLAAIYGKQLPHDNANVIAQHARKFNYSDNSYVVSKDSAKELGLKAVFMSNSFSAYRVSAFLELGGFAMNTILCEDMLYAATALLHNYHVGYAANATVKHSHNYTCKEEFARYFDIGVFHSEQSWIRKEFGGAGGEGKKFLISEFQYIMKAAPVFFFSALLNNAAKFLGYQLGKRYKLLSSTITKKCSMHKNFWE
ncbi:glycosyltransferase family 2 protein [Escherichia albertii]|uniref:glycosyltransferase family 2 protein n=1 Tax=Escherichia albertii TaxID=208962 RepID=UPI0016B46569|nr:glycosyltransferase family A protein [Escherichia albertii]MCQ8909753.1 glycosyltransferase family 2 protein [Escherichia albertii]MCQ8958665.1 glycosyltransferase family 2 protein [Escherichia albertii]MCQ8990295.1 glycosyltransferase family 2 protein [Escherichia albertii]UUL29298.1 glycosyltransferase family 2 protein [Escherichia albertii]UUL47560.1 glycosyltransferase family 2 protein [Escherichia albertii]